LYIGILVSFLSFHQPLYFTTGDEREAMATTYAARLTEFGDGLGSIRFKQANLAGLAEAVRAKNVAQDRVGAG